MLKVKNTGNGKQDLADLIRGIFWTIVGVAFLCGAIAVGLIFFAVKAVT